jgi:beta-xylosidase
MTTTAVDTKYEIKAKFSIGEGGRAGLYLFYNEEANIGYQGTQSQLWICITNECNKVSILTSTDGENWITDAENVDVSSYHHNVYKGFFALRPAYFLAGDAKLESFDYKVIE